MMLRRTDLEDIKKAEIYLNKQLQIYQLQKADYYTLYLAVKNYADRIKNLQLEVLNQYQTNSPQNNSNKINNVVVGSSKSTGQNNFDMVQKSEIGS